MLRRAIVIAPSLALVAACSVQTVPSFPDAGELGDASWLFRDSAVPPGIDAGPPPPGCEPEACDNGLDDDCDGSVDEGCACIPGTERSCYRGRAETRDHGACRAGTMVC
ncbi:MAG: hypothetical protein M5U28_53250, partial [Sandaracinaceae bacterium]|nr:hypothetical protein [Sandaracinaceae bacterium]